MRGGDGAGKREDDKPPPPFSAGEAGDDPTDSHCGGPIIKVRGHQNGPRRPKIRKPKIPKIPQNSLNFSKNCGIS